MSNDTEEDYVEFGTPLEPLDEDVCPRKKPFTLEEQFARDKHGRRRFHGAFTGGFSAGFLNTVGSLEGWKPATFKSSKTEKSTAVVQRPEQFMDEEDMGEFGIAPYVLHAKEEFLSTGNNKRKYQDHVFGTSVLKNLLQPVRETIGIKLLKKMGWKPGQGTGPRIGKQEKKRLSKLRKKMYGCSLPNEKSESTPEEDSDDEDLEKITFAPEDYPFQLIKSKDNLFGLGYRGLEKRSILCTPTSKQDFQVVNKKSISGQAFGVGAFEEEDEDIYSREDMSQYDFSLGDNSILEGSASGCILGEDLYDAFARALKKTVKKIFPPPTLPKDFKPVHKVRVSRFETVTISNTSRQLESPDRNISLDEIDEIQKEARKITQPDSSSSNSCTAFRPFISDMDKQKRYEMYLNLANAGKKVSLSSLQPITMTEWEKEKEKVEFEQASKLFKPLSGIMEDRFIVASQPDDIHDPLARVEKARSGSEDEINAARMNLYGRLTRTMEDWKPCSLLCKRFNVPELKKDEIPIVKSKEKYSIFDDISSLISENKTDVKTKVDDYSYETVESKNNENITDSLPDNSDIINLPDTMSKIDLFNAIFLDTDEDDVTQDSETGIGVAKSEERQDPAEFVTPYEENIGNTERNTSPARGIFEHIDGSIFLTKGKTETLAKPDTTDFNRTVKELEVNESDKLMYGPKLPDKFPVRKVGLVTEQSEYNDDDYCWVVKSERKKHKKKEKKYKKSKHKSKHKHKKNKR